MLEAVEHDYNIHLGEKMFTALQLVFDNLPSDEAGLGEELYAAASAAVHNGLGGCCPCGCNDWPTTSGRASIRSRSSTCPLL